MLKRLTTAVLLAALGIAVAKPAQSQEIDIGFTELTGVTGGTPQGTSIFRANLSDLGIDLNSLTIRDNAGGLGGFGQQFTGFDLDAIVLSRVEITDASMVGDLNPIDIFNFDSGITFTPGTQRAPVQPMLFGTLAPGNIVDTAVATLDSFDGNSTVDTNVADGFVSLGDNGIISFDLTSTLDTTGPLFLYVGEVGNNGEVPASGVTVSSDPVNPPPVPLSL